MRLRIRTYKPEIFGHEKLGRLQDRSAPGDSEFRLMLGLISLADDDGRLRDAPRTIVGFVWPNTPQVSERRVERWLANLERERLIVRYGCGRERYIAIRGWRKHQKIDKPRRSILPAPDGFDAQEQGTLGGDFAAPNSTNGRRSVGDTSATDQGSGIRDQDQGRDDPPEAPPQAGGLELSDLWDQVEDRINDMVGSFGPVEPVSLADDTLTVRGPTRGQAIWLHDRYGLYIERLVTEVRGKPTRLFVENGQPEPKPRRRQRRRTAA